MKYVFSTLGHASPSWMMYHLMQLAGCPENVGADGPSPVLDVGESFVAVGLFGPEVCEFERAGSE